MHERQAKLSCTHAHGRTHDAHARLYANAHMQVSGCHVKAGGASAIGKMLGLNQKLKTLLVDRCFVGDAGAASIAEGLWDNSALTELGRLYNTFEL